MPHSQLNNLTYADKATADRKFDGKDAECPTTSMVADQEPAGAELTNTDLMSYVVSLPRNKRVALMASASSSFPKDVPFYTGYSGEYTHEAPAANILHNKDTITKNTSLYLNYEPSDLELGLAWRAEIANVFFIQSDDPLVIGQYKINQDGFTLHTPCELTEVNILDVEQKNALENHEQRLVDAFNDENSFNQRNVSPVIAEALGRGLELESPIVDDLEQRKIDEHFIRIVLALVDRGWNSRDGSTKPEERVAGNNIAAIMVDKNNKIIGWGLNLKKENKTFHAETLMIQRYLKEHNTNTLPEGVKIYTSLECCHMCSSFITTVGQDIKVIYAQKDPYFNGENTLSCMKNGCSQERTTLHFPDTFKKEIGDNENILDFLFSSKARTIFNKGFYEPALFIDIAKEAAERRKRMNIEDFDSELEINTTVSPILVYGEEFLEQLGGYTPPTTPSREFFRSRTPSPTQSSSPSSSPSRSPSRSPSSDISRSPTFSTNSIQSMSRELDAYRSPAMIKSSFSRSLNESLKSQNDLADRLTLRRSYS